MKKIILIFGVLLLSVVVLVSANGDHQSEIEESREIVESGIGCDELSNGQLEAIGEYYMEQMHPGEAHKIMDNMMGGEGSESLKQVHINMAKRLYCNEDVGGMMGGGMMAMMGNNMMGNSPGYYGYDSFGYGSFWNIVWLIFLIGVIALIIWLIYKFTKKRVGGLVSMEKNTEKNKNAWLWILVVVVVLLSLFGGLGTGGYGMMSRMGWGFGTGFGFFFMLLFWGIVAWLFFTLVNTAQSGRNGDSPRDSPLDILKKRYASGEITKKQYEDMKKELNR